MQTYINQYCKKMMTTQIMCKYDFLAPLTKRAYVDGLSTLIIRVFIITRQNFQNSRLTFLQPGSFLFGHLHITKTSSGLKMNHLLLVMIF